MIVLDRFPLCPSENNMYLNLKGRGRIAAPNLRKFKKDVQDYGFTIPYDTRQKIKELPFVPLELWLVFYVNKDSLYSKAGLPKKWDVGNRIKAAADAIMGLIGRDDCWLFKVTCHKVPLMVSDTNGGYITCVLSPFEPKPL